LYFHEVVNLKFLLMLQRSRPIKKGKSAWSLSAKLTAAYSLLILLAAGGLTSSLYLQLRRAQLQAIRDRLQDIVSLAAPQIDRDFHALILTNDDADLPYYRIIEQRLKDIQASSDAIERIYTLRQKPDGDIVVVVDYAPPPYQRVAVGKKLDSLTPLLQAGLNSIKGPVVEEKLRQNSASKPVVYGYAPIITSLGVHEGVLAIQLDASAVINSEVQARNIALLNFFGTLPVALAVGWWLAKRLTSPVAKLVVAAEQIALGKLDTVVSVQSADEMGLLADTFNRMSSELQILYGRLQDHLSMVVEHAPIVLFALNRQGEYTLAKGKGLLALGRQPSEIIGQSIADVYSEVPEISETIARALAGEKFTSTLEMAGLTFEVWLSPLQDQNGEITGVIGVSHDITDLKLSEANEREKSQQLAHAVQQLQQAQAQLVHSEKMSSLGQLVAGIAHEINNPVSFIYGNLFHITDYTDNLLQLLALYQEALPEPTAEIESQIEDMELDYITEDLPKLINSINTGADRIKEIVRSLRNFSRLDETGIKTVSLHAGLDSTLMILQHRLKNISVVKEYGEIPDVKCDPGQINQVFMNILSNAIDALELGVGEFCSSSRETISIRTTMPDDQRVKIAFVDNGPGMTEDVRKRVFDPFFTTKKVGSGTGMGMSISYSIVVEQHKGELYCISAPGKGTELVVEIPIGPQDNC